MSVVLAFGATVLLTGPATVALVPPTAVAIDTTAAALFARARTQLRRGEAAAGLAAYLRAADHASGVADWALFGRDMAWIATPAELAAWSKASPAERPELLRSFWAERDARDGLAPGERLVAHVRRLDMAMHRYRIHPKHGKAPVMRVSSGADAGADAAVVGINSQLRDYVPSQGELDDRGVIYLRQGEPASITYTGGIGLESWSYERDGRVLTVHFADALFDGSSGNGMLVASPPVGALTGLCQVDPAYCSAAVSHYDRPEQRERLRQVALGAIKTLTTSDTVAAVVDAK